MSEIELIEALKRNDYKKNKIKIIAESFNITETELKKFYITYFFRKVSEKINILTLRKILELYISKTLKGI